MRSISLRRSYRRALRHRRRISPRCGITARDIDPEQCSTDARGLALAPTVSAIVNRPLFSHEEACSAPVKYQVPFGNQEEQTMTEETAAPSGPDLSGGLDLAQLAENAMVLGHVGPEAILLVRRGEEIFAIGNSCSHYHGPLNEGLVVGDTVRSPWHHACFSLRTGEKLRAPALDGVPCWRVERQGNLVYVREKKEPAAGAVPPPA